VANLFLFAAGTLRAHPGEVLNEQAFARLLRDSLKWFHKVVIDTAAVGIHPDALPLARHADAVCLVVNARTTDRRAALRAAERLRAAGAAPVGFVLTSAPAAALSTGLAGEFAASFTPAPAVPALPPASA
jgi:Mrp family chromosome partitioning ATPase